MSLPLYVKLTANADVLQRQALPPLWREQETLTVDGKEAEESNSQELQVPVWDNQFLVQIRYALYYF